MIDRRKRYDNGTVVGGATGTGTTIDIGLPEGKDPEIIVCEKLSAQQWWDIASWGKETNALENWQRGIAGSIARFIGSNRDPSIKQAKQGITILKIAANKGFIQDQALQEVLNKL